MVRAPYVILGIGFAGCVALAWMAQSLQRQGRARTAATLPAAVGAAFADRLAGPLAAHEEQDGAGLRRVFTGRAIAGVDRSALAHAIAAAAAQRASADGAACTVAVTLRDAAGADPRTVERMVRPASPR